MDSKILPPEGCVFVPVGKSHAALIDIEDSELVLQKKWRLDKYGYAYTAGWVKMHQLILGKKVGLEIDHINRVKLDNRRSNLRFVTHAQNRHNTSPTGKSAYKGVTLAPPRQGRGLQYVAEMSVGQKIYKIGVYKTEEQAARAYDRAMRSIGRTHAYLNFPNEF